MEPLTSQVTSLEFDLLNNTIRLKAHQPVNGAGLIKALKNIIKSKNFTVHIMNDDQLSFSFTRVNVISHRCELNYALNGPVSHLIDMSFEEIQGTYPIDKNDSL